MATYQVDPTRDEALNYAQLLMQAGVPTELHHHAYAFHLVNIIPGTKIYTQLAAVRVDAIRRLLHTPIA